MTDVNLDGDPQLKVIPPKYFLIIEVPTLWLVTFFSFKVRAQNYKQEELWLDSLWSRILVGKIYLGVFKNINLDNS